MQAQEPNNLNDAPCSACGAPMKYDARTAQMNCEHCGQTRAASLSTQVGRLFNKEMGRQMQFHSVASYFAVLIFFIIMLLGLFSFWRHF